MKKLRKILLTASAFLVLTGCKVEQKVPIKMEEVKIVSPKYRGIVTLQDFNGDQHVDNIILPDGSFMYNRTYRDYLKNTEGFNKSKELSENGFILNGASAIYRAMIVHQDM
ncbi:MAG: hypothetical protein ABIJ14_00010 [Nanoarchaeota archaeon]